MSAVTDLRRAILALDPQNDFEPYLTAVAGEILGATGALACGVARRFSGAARDLGLLVRRDGEPLRKAVFLDRSERFHHPESPAGSRAPGDFATPVLASLAEAEGIRPERVVVIPVPFHGRPVITVEVADPDPARLPDPEALAEVLADLAPEFKVAVIQERLRRERLEARLLYEAARELGRPLDLPSVLTSILDLLRQVVPFDAAAIYVLDKDALSAVHQSLRGYAEDQEAVVNLKLMQGIVGWVAHNGEAEIVSDVSRDTRYLQARPETRSEMVVPLLSGGRVIGVFNLESDRSGAYNPHDLEVLETFARLAASALERARLLEEQKSRERLSQELAIARRIQRSFLPQSTDRRNRRHLVGKWLPSEEVSGDYYDFLERKDGSVAIALADVSGKGIPAALIMASLRAAFRLEAGDGDDPARLCRSLNAFLFASTRQMEFATGVFGFLDAAHRRFHYCNAGHNPPAVLRKDGSLEWLESGGMVLGAFPEVEYEGGSVDLEPGDQVVLYTDGVTEAHPGNHEEFGTERLVEVLRATRGRHPEEVTDAIVSAVRAFVSGPLPDDLTLVVIQGGEGAP